MRTMLGSALIVAVSLWAAGGTGQQPKEGKVAEEEAQVIEVTAKKYEFNPSEIRVKRGTQVRLKLRAIDRTHGFKIERQPEGENKNGPPGLRFSSPQETWKLEKDQERVIEFFAERPGTYHYKCAVFCGFGHRGMKGKLIVEE